VPINKPLFTLIFFVLKSITADQREQGPFRKINMLCNQQGLQFGDRRAPEHVLLSFSPVVSGIYLPRKPVWRGENLPSEYIANKRNEMATRGVQDLVRGGRGRSSISRGVII
jgi:hypothetical protein